MRDFENSVLSLASNLEVYAQPFPDRIFAREQYWLPFLENELAINESTILLGYSVGAAAVMRFAEKHIIQGSVLIAPYHTDLKNPFESFSGYFNRGWNWQAIKAHQSWIVQFSSTDDRYISITESRTLQQFLGSEYYELPGRGHFLSPTFAELYKVLATKLAVVED